MNRTNQLMNLMRKIITSGLIIFSAIITCGQTSTFSLAINYSPNFSAMTNEVVPARIKVSHDVGATMVYNLTPSLGPTLSFRYFNTGEVTGGKISNHPIIQESTYTYSYAYLQIPVGIRVKIGPVEVLPEIGYAFALSQTVTSKLVTTNKTEKTKRPEELINGAFNNPVIPISLTLSSDVHIGPVTTQMGIKGFYSANIVAEGVPREAHFYGIGILLGVKLK